MIHKTKNIHKPKKPKYVFKRETSLVPVRERKQLTIDDETTKQVEFYNGLPSEVLKKILGYLSINLTVKESCLRCGVSREYFDQLYMNDVDGIRQQVENAKLSSKIHHLKRIHSADKGWQASAWFLERTDRRGYGRDVKPEDVLDEKQKITIGNMEIEF